MASSTDPEFAAKATTLPPKSDVPPSWWSNCSLVDVALRVLLFSATLVAIIVMVTSEQSEFERPAKFNHSPAFIYFVAALAVVCFYSIITILVSILVIFKPTFHKKFLLHFAFWDVLMLGLVASATGAAAAVAYIGLKGNSHVQWGKVCSTYDKFCRHVASSTALALFAAVVLVFLSMLSTHSLYKRIRD
ncbi:hypothetical protein Q3G72_009106 [Acer saccharum]|nr:hypothetical protein Q3G72_009106 [Acer saccharum]